LIAQDGGFAMKGKGKQFVPHGRKVMLAFPELQRLPNNTMGLATAISRLVENFVKHGEQV